MLRSIAIALGLLASSILSRTGVEVVAFVVVDGRGAGAGARSEPDLLQGVSWPLSAIM